MASQLPLNKTVSARPPDKGSFPIDHLSECKKTMIDYLKCLKDYKFEGDKCRDLSKAYLKCRMDNNLMAKEEWKYLGFKDETSEATMPTGLNTTHGQSIP